jgi:hypothetical protein
MKAGRFSMVNIFASFTVLPKLKIFYVICYRLNLPFGAARSFALGIEAVFARFSKKSAKFRTQKSLQVAYFCARSESLENAQVNKKKCLVEWAPGRLAANYVGPWISRFYPRIVRDCLSTRPRSQVRRHCDPLGRPPDGDDPSGDLAVLKPDGTGE